MSTPRYPKAMVKTLDLNHVSREIGVELEWVAKGLPQSPYVDPASAAVLAAEGMEGVAPYFWAMDDEVNLITGIPVGELPDTPLDGKRVKTPLLTELFALGMAHILHLEPMSYEDEKDGEVIHQVCPVPGKETAKSNQGSDDFALHIEAPHHDVPPGFLMLMGLRGNPQAYTTFSRLHPALEDVEDWAMDVLLDDAFDVRLGESFGSRATVRVPVLTVNPNDGMLDVRVDFEEMKPVGPAATKAMAQLKQALWDGVQHHALKAGEMLFWDNRRVVHGRTHFPVTYDGTQRWLQRLYLTDQFPHKWAADESRPWVVRGT